MSWSGNCRIPSGIDFEQGSDLIRAIVVPENEWNGAGQADQVTQAKAAAITLLSGLPERVGVDVNVQINGHASLEGQNWDSISASVNHTPALPSQPTEYIAREA